MDPLERLAQRNTAHKTARKKEKRELLWHIPITVISILSYMSIYIFLVTDDINPNDLPITVKPVWVVSNLLTLGLGATLFVSSIAFLVFLYFLTKYIKVNILKLKVATITAMLFLVSVSFFALGNFCNSLIYKNKILIANCVTISGDSIKLEEYGFILLHAVETNEQEIQDSLVY